MRGEKMHPTDLNSRSNWKGAMSDNILNNYIVLYAYKMERSATLQSLEQTSDEKTPFAIER